MFHMLCHLAESVTKVCCHCRAIQSLPLSTPVCFVSQWWCSSEDFPKSLVPGSAKTVQPHKD